VRTTNGTKCVFLAGAISSCLDGIQNGDEEGVDCGGSCPGVCSNSQSRVRSHFGLEPALTFVHVVRVSLVFASCAAASFPRAWTICALTGVAACLCLPAEREGEDADDAGDRPGGSWLCAVLLPHLLLPVAQGTVPALLVTATHTRTRALPLAIVAALHSRSRDLLSLPVCVCARVCEQKKQRAAKRHKGRGTKDGKKPNAVRTSMVMPAVVNWSESVRPSKQLQEPFRPAM
jgi:hypothetical protein